MSRNRFDKFGSAKKRVFLDLLRQGGRRYASARAAGVCGETVRLHMHRDEQFANDVIKAELEANELVENALFEAASKGNVVACQVWLYNREPERWKDKRAVEHTGRDGGPIKTDMVVQRALADDESCRALATLSNRLSLAAGHVESGQSGRNGYAVPLDNGSAP